MDCLIAAYCTQWTTSPCLGLQFVMLSLQTCYITSWHIFSLLSDTSEHIVGFTLQWQTVYLDSLRMYFHLCVLLCLFPPLSLSLSVLYLPTSLLFLARPQSLWHSLCCKVPLSTSITITGSDFLHHGSASPEDPPEFHTEIRSHTHSLRKNASQHGIDAGYIIYLLIYSSVSVHLSFGFCILGGYHDE